MELDASNNWNPPGTESTVQHICRALCYASAAEELFGEERLLGFVAANAALPAGRFADALLAELAAWSGASDGTQRDDVTLIVVDLVG